LNTVLHAGLADLEQILLQFAELELSDLAKNLLARASTKLDQVKTAAVAVAPPEA